MNPSTAIDYEFLDDTIDYWQVSQYLLFFIYKLKAFSICCKFVKF